MHWCSRRCSRSTCIFHRTGGTRGEDSSKCLTWRLVHGRCAQESFLGQPKAWLVFRTPSTSHLPCCHVVNPATPRRPGSAGTSNQTSPASRSSGKFCTYLVKRSIPGTLFHHVSRYRAPSLVVPGLSPGASPKFARTGRTRIDRAPQPC